MYYKSTEVESTFIEILNPRKLMLIAGCIYHYPHIDLLNKVIEYYTNNLFDKLSEENKTVFVLGDLNKDLLKYDQH